MKSLSVLIKPCSSNCNMHCQYCFYIDESQKRTTCSYGYMSEAVHEAIIKQIFSCLEESCTILFQGGEPTMAGLDFYRRHIALVKKYNTHDFPVHHSIQTNGILINREWARFFAENHFLVGLSLDGPEHLHDSYRVDLAGNGTYKQVLEAVHLLQEYRVDFNIISTVTNQIAENPDQVYRHFCDLGCRYHQYIPCMDPFEETHGHQAYSLLPEQYGKFLIALFDIWYQDMITNHPVYIRYFYNLLAIMFRQAPESCDMQGICSNQYVIEADGSVFPCDFYVLDKWYLGNIISDDFSAFDHRRKELRFIEQSFNHSAACKACDWFPLCRGGCRRDREAWNHSEVGTNYYCDSFKQFFAHAYPRLRRICDLAHNGKINLFQFD